ncbi:MAG: trypsin-like serine protease [Pirellulaceae bacterium]|nr:trypsin-like serine protease [Pirellulaceae bacterium]
MTFLYCRRLILVLLLAIPLSNSLIADDSQASDPPGESSGELRGLIAKVRPSIATIRVEGRDGDALGIGTGFVVDSTGLIATNYHVINEGRKFTVELADKKLKVLAVEASDRVSDLVLIRVDTTNGELPALEIADDSVAEQGTAVLAFGNPLGLQDSVVDGIVSAVREVQGREMIQLAMPIEQGNSGGPLVDRSGRVLGIINMKSALDENLSFAIPIRQLRPLREKPNPVSMQRWVRLTRINQQRWQPMMGATWQQRGGIISARGSGKGFGGRSLCLSTQPQPDSQFDVVVLVKLDDESGAAGIAFHSDGKHKHYGFYPSSGRLRLTCFKGPTVYSWQVLEEVESEHYLSEQWNRLRVRISDDEIQCFVNGHLVITSTDRQLTSGKIGLVKFRDTNPDFRGFEIGVDLQAKSLSQQATDWFAMLDQKRVDADRISADQLDELGKSGDLASGELVRRALELERSAQRVRQLAEDVRRVPTLAALKQLFQSKDASPNRLLEATLLVARLDHPEIDVDYYEQRIDEMADEIRADLAKDATDADRREALDRYLFKENGFHGGRSEYYHPANSHLNRVIDDREGLPITLSILYMELGRRLDLTIEGVGLPGHFVVNHVTDQGDNQLIDVFDGGRSMSRNDASLAMLQYSGRTLRDEDLRAQSDEEIVTRVLSNLMGIATRSEDLEAMLRYIEAIVAINPEAVNFRMMRAQLRGMTNRNSRAVEDIEWLLQKDPPGIDQGRLEEMRAAIED